MKFATVFHYSNKEKIPDYRPEHRTYIAGLREAGRVTAAGPFEDDSGALIVYEAESAAEVEKLIEDDPFFKAGIFAEKTIKPWKQVL